MCAAVDDGQACTGSAMLHVQCTSCQKDFNMSLGSDVSQGTRVCAPCPFCTANVEVDVPVRPPPPIAVARPLAPTADVGVRAVGFSDVQHDAGKAYREFMFNLTAAGIEETVQFRFSSLCAMHGRLAPGGDLAFPSKHLFRDMNKAHNAEMRSRELEQYLRTLLNRCDPSGRIITDPQLQMTLRCTSLLVQGLTAVAAVRQEREAERRRAEDARRQAEAARLEAIRQQQIQDMQFAQNINHHVGAPGQAVTMIFPRQLTFELRSKMFSWRDQVAIRGPGGLDWFGMLRTSSVFSMLDTEVIATRAGEPILALQRQFRWMHYEYTLNRITASMSIVPLCSVTRQPQLFAPATYTIQMLAPSFGGHITCAGLWFEDFVLHQAGAPACRIRRRAWSIPECYDVVIEPQHDVLLFLGIACAIDHIHHEIEENHRR